MTGSISFFDVSNINTPTLIGEATAFATSYHAFSPDSRYFIAATLSPKLRIDNGFKMFTYNGELLSKEDQNEMYKIQFDPMPEDYQIERFDLVKRKADKKASPGIYRHPKFTQNNSALRQNQVYC